jgi:tetratricopeptide (TPR) repeat protein
MSTFNACIEKVAQIGMGLTLLAFSPDKVSAGAGIVVAMSGIASVVKGNIDKHGPESAKSIAEIQTQTAGELAYWLQIEGFDPSDSRVVTASEALSMHLETCMLNREDLAKSAISVNGFPKEASRLVLAALAEKTPVFLGESQDLERRFATLVIENVLIRAIANKAYFSELNPHLTIEIARALGGVVETTTRTETKIDDLTAMVSQLIASGTVAKAEEIGLSRTQIETILSSFGHEGLPTDQWARALLGSAAQLQDLKARLATLTNDEPEIAALKASAKQAIDASDFARADALLAEAERRDIEAGSARIQRGAESRALRAELATTRGALLEAADHYAAAANLIFAFDKARWAAWKLREGIRAHDYGLLFPSLHLMRAKGAFHAALGVYTRADMPADWAGTQNNLGATLQVLGRRFGGPDGLAYLQDSVAAYRGALEVYTRADMPADWAMTQNNLGNTLRVFGLRSDGPEGLAYLQDSVAAYRAALEVRTRADMPANWAGTQNNLGNTLKVLGERSGGPDGLAYLQDSVAANRGALEVYTRADMPADWAMTQNNLGNTLRVLGGLRSDGPEGLAYLQDSVAAYRGALEVYTRADMPANWAMTQNNLGNTLRVFGLRSDGPEGLAYLQNSVAAYRGALEVFTRADMPADWAMTNENLAIVFLALFHLTSDASYLDHAQTAAAQALEVYQQGGMAYDVETCTNLLAQIKSARGG